MVSPIHSENWGEVGLTRIGHFREMGIAGEDKEGRKSIDEAPTKMAFFRNLRGQDCKQGKISQGSDADVPFYKIAL